MLQNALQQHYTVVPILLGDHRRKSGKQPSGLPTSKKLLICTRFYHLEVVSSANGDAYFVRGIHKSTLRERDRLARGTLKLSVNSWHVYDSFSELNRRVGRLPLNSNGFERILDTFNRLDNYKRWLKDAASEESAKALTPAQEHYLNTLEKLIKITEDAELTKEEQRPTIQYDEIKATATSRYRLRDVYSFHLAPGEERVQRGDHLCIQGKPQLRGRVIKADESGWFKVRFDERIDIKDIRPPGTLEQIKLGAQFRALRQAVETLCSGTAANSCILPVLVEQNYHRYQPDTNIPRQSLNDAQFDALSHCLTVPDILLILGPPGTGKTYTIIRMIQLLQKKHWRILVTSRTHRAVDNVLENLVRMPDNQLTVLRFGKEDKISPTNKHLLLDTQAKKMQQRILDITKEHAQQLEFFASTDHLQELDHHISTLSELSTQLQHRLDALQQDRQRLNQERWKIEQFFTGVYHQLQQQQLQLDKDIALFTKKIERLERMQKWAESHGHLFLIGQCFLWCSSFLQRNLLKRYQHRQSLQDQNQFLVRERERARGDHQQAYHSPSYQRLDQQVKQAELQEKALFQHVVSQLQPCHDVVSLLADILCPPAGSQKMLRTEDVLSYLSWFLRTWRDQGRNLLIIRCNIMHGWHTRLQTGTEELHPVLIRMADVIGTTCIGSATAKELAEVEFDLAITDEAGQINILDLLVPLARAKKAILVGDHQQLPPFFDQHVERYLKQLEITLSLKNDEDTLVESEHAQEVIRSQMREMLSTSVFEMLFESAFENKHLIRFTEQRRMPEAVAEFVSMQFYDGTLRTLDKDKRYGAAHFDPLFDHSLVFIDTASLPLEERHDTEEKVETDRPSYSNKAEARIIAAIAELYHREGHDWMIIVPYQAQASLIYQEMKALLGDDADVARRITPVDSFQGGESSKVIYSFTRSNTKHHVGFQKELRRLNVALTRTKHQLILVGDSVTLKRARNRGFRKLAEDLLTHVCAVGRIWEYRACFKYILQKKGSSPSNYDD